MVNSGVDPVGVWLLIGLAVFTIIYVGRIWYKVKKDQNKKDSL